MTFGAIAEASETAPLHWNLEDEQKAVRVGAVSYLNTVPLVWGMLHGAEQSEVNLSFSIPSACAAALESGAIDVGLVPVAEIARQELTIVADVGIASRGPVRSILLVSRVPVTAISTLSVDLSSRTSVQLAKVILRERYGVRPTIMAELPNLDAMLAHADAALIIGDPALRIEPGTVPYECLDLGAEWDSLTGLPMVFAAWASKPGAVSRRFRDLADSSYRYGQLHLSEIVSSEYQVRGITQALAFDYFTRYLRFQLGPDEMRGLEAFFELAELMPSRSLRS